MGSLLCRRAGQIKEHHAEPQAPASWALHVAAYSVRKRLPPATLLETCLRAFAEQPERFHRDLPRLPQVRALCPFPYPCV